MKILLQKVKNASVTVDGEEVGAIGRGYLIFIGIMEEDSWEAANWLAQKVTSLRLFDGDYGKINEASLMDVGGEVLVVSQFTLAAKLEKGNRPDYTRAAAPDIAERLYKHFIYQLKEMGVAKVEAGTFGAHMEVTLTNDGPVTLLIEK